MLKLDSHPGTPLLRTCQGLPVSLRVEWKGLRVSPGFCMSLFLPPYSCLSYPSSYSSPCPESAGHTPDSLHAVGCRGFAHCHSLCHELVFASSSPRTPLHPLGSNKVVSVRPPLIISLKLNSTTFPSLLLSIQITRLHYIYLFHLGFVSFHKNISSMWAGIWTDFVHNLIFSTSNSVCL